MSKKTNDVDTYSIISDIVAEVALERVNQVERWGQQDHPSFISEMDRRQAQAKADYWKERNDSRVQRDLLAWDGILLEEVWEALAERDDVLRRIELIQVAAVAVAEVEAIDRRMGDSPNGGIDCPATGEPCEKDCDTPCEPVSESEAA